MAAVHQEAVVPGSPPPLAGPPTPWPVSGKVSLSGHLRSLHPHCCTLPGQTETSLHVSVLIDYICKPGLLYILSFTDKKLKVQLIDERVSCSGAASVILRKKYVFVVHALVWILLVFPSFMQITAAELKKCFLTIVYVCALFAQSTPYMHLS